MTVPSKITRAIGANPPAKEEQILLYLNEIHELIRKLHVGHSEVVDALQDHEDRIVALEP